MVPHSKNTQTYTQMYVCMYVFVYMGVLSLQQFMGDGKKDERREARWKGRKDWEEENLVRKEDGGGIIM